MGKKRSVMLRAVVVEVVGFQILEELMGVGTTCEIHVIQSPHSTCDFQTLSDYQATTISLLPDW